MSYNEIVKKYEGKKRGLLVLFIIFEAAIMSVLIVSDLFVRYLIEETGAPDSSGFFKSGHIFAVYAVIGAVMIIADILIVRMIKNVRNNIRRIQEDTGLPDDDRFAEIYTTCQPLPSLKNVLVGDQYLFNFDSWWGCRLDSITEVSQETTGSTRVGDDGNYSVKVRHNGRSSSIYTTELNQKKVYGALCKAAGLPEKQE